MDTEHKIIILLIAILWLVRGQLSWLKRKKEEDRKLRVQLAKNPFNEGDNEIWK
jgi:hypothetical protein